MTNKTLPMTGQLFQAAKRITVEPGQYVIVVADLVVGVYTGDRHVPIVEAVQPVVQTPPKHTATAKASPGKPSPKYRTYLQDTPTPALAPIVACIRTHMLAYPTSKASEIAVLAESHGARPWTTRDALRWLHYHGYITRSGPNVNRTYRATDKLKQEASQEAA